MIQHRSIVKRLLRYKDSFVSSNRQMEIENNKICKTFKNILYIYRTTAILFSFFFLLLLFVLDLQHVFIKIPTPLQTSPYYELTYIWQLVMYYFGVISYLATDTFFCGLMLHVYLKIKKLKYSLKYSNCIFMEDKQRDNLMNPIIKWVDYHGSLIRFSDEQIIKNLLNNILYHLF